MRGLASARLMLVLATVLFQSVEVSDSFARVRASPLWIVSGATVPALFALAGFVLAVATAPDEWRGSMARRLRHTFPTLFIAILGAAFVIGPLTTTLPRAAYLGDPLTWAYALNLIGWPQFELPGVFEFNNAQGVVNGVLWSVPCFAMLIAVLALAMQGRRAGLLIALAFAAAVVGGVAFAMGGGSEFGRSGIAASLLSGPFHTSALCFLLGALGGLWRERLPIDGRIAVACGGLVIALAIVGNAGWWNRPVVTAVMAPVLTYLAVYSAFSDLPFPRLSTYAHRYLIGLFLYSYPVQQLAIAIGPARQNAATNFTLTLPVVIVLAVGSWHLVCRPLSARFAPMMARVGSPEADARDGGWVLVWRERRPGGAAALVREAGPLVIGSLALILCIIAVMALVLFALQRDAVGV